MQTPESLSQRCRVRITGVGLGAPAFLTGLLFFVLLSHSSSLHILEINGLQIHGLQTFSPIP